MIKAGTKRFWRGWCRTAELICFRKASVALFSIIAVPRRRDKIRTAKNKTYLTATAKKKPFYFMERS